VKITSILNVDLLKDWKEVMRKCMWGACDTDWGLEKLKGKGLRAVICKLVLGASVYNIWLQRSCRNFREQALSEESIMKAILWYVKNRVSSKKGFKNSVLNRVLCFEWGIPLSILSD